jgi:ketosteroid isomerase-like protein
MPEESTTPNLVELAGQFLEAQNLRDFDALEGFYAPNAVLVGAEVGTFEGSAAIRALFEDFVSPYEEFHVEFEEALDLGNDVGFYILVATGRPFGSTKELRLRSATVVMASEGFIERQTNYMDIDEARAAAERLAEERG